MRPLFWLAGLICMVLVHDVAFAQNPSYFSDPVRTELAAMGKPGLVVALARDKVNEILQSENACSAWFQKADARAAATFASLKFVIDTKGPRYIEGWRTEKGEVLFKHPYSASAVEGTGRNALVTLNANGPFFVRTGLVEWQESGGFHYVLGRRVLVVGPYFGDTLDAQITTLLHEFGHVIGRIPDDSDELSGLSGRNTEQVVHFCHAQIKAAARHPGRSAP